MDKNEKKSKTSKQYIILSLDLSTSTGYAVLTEKGLLTKGLFVHKVEDFDVNKYPERSPLYPYNIVDVARKMGNFVGFLVMKYNPTHIVIENTVKGMNRNTQRLLEFIHYAVLSELIGFKNIIYYQDPSRWRSILKLKLSKEQSKHNRLVKQGKIRGKITRKHLSVWKANEYFGLDLKLKDDDIADSLCQALAFEQELIKNHG